MEVVRQFSDALAAGGHSATIVCMDDPVAPWRTEWRHPVCGLGPARGLYGGSVRLLPWLKRYHEHFDAVLVHGLWQYPTLGTWRALRRTATPYFVFPHGMLDPVFKRAYPLKHLKKCLYWLWVEARVLRDARAVLFTCEEERRLARGTFPFYRCREQVAPPGLAPPPGDPARQRELFLGRFPQCRGRRLVLFLGRLHGKKGCDLLLKAFPQALPSPDWRLVMAGPDQSASAFQRLAAQAGFAERVEWTGLLSGDLKWGAFHAAEVFVLPSHQENFGMAVAEALACGVPVLLSNKVNIWREVVQDGAGFVAEDTLSGTTALLRNWLTLPAAEQAQFRVRARSCFAARFEITRAAATLVEVLRASGVTSTAPPALPPIG